MFTKKVIGVISAATLMMVFAGAPAAHAANQGPEGGFPQPVVGGPTLDAPQLGGSTNGDTSLTVDPGYLEFDPVDVYGNGGAVSAWQMPSFTGIVLGGTPELTGVQIPPFSVIDATGSAAGWNVLMHVDDLVHLASVDGGPDYTIPNDNMSMTKPWVVDQDTDTGSGPVTPDIETRSNNGNVLGQDVVSFDDSQGGTWNGGPVVGNKIVVADPANPAPGASTNPTNGTFLISPMPLRVLVPSDASVGTYNTQVTLDLISGP
jgi:hypothetical protein